MTNQEKVQLSVAVGIKNKSNNYFFKSIIFLIFMFGMKIDILSQVNEFLPTGIKLAAGFLYLWNFFFALIEISIFRARIKKLDQYAKEGKTFDEAYTLLFEEKEK